MRIKIEKGNLQAVTDEKSNKPKKQSFEWRIKFREVRKNFGKVKLQKISCNKRETEEKIERAGRKKICSKARKKDWKVIYRMLRAGNK